VKVFLRDTLNGWFFKGPSRWTPRQPEALDLGRLAWAVEMVFQQHLEHVEILLCYDDPRYNVVLPIDRLQRMPHRANSDLQDQPLVEDEKSQEKRSGKKSSL
jgi:hypothetical protein